MFVAFSIVWLIGAFVATTVVIQGDKAANSAETFMDFLCVVGWPIFFYIGWRRKREIERR